MGIVITGGSAVAAEFQAAATAMPEALGEALEGYGDTLADAVKSHASGRPGPEIVTGDYVGSIGVVRTGGAGSIQVEVGTDQPQGYRLELGFSGSDSLGRQYDQPPFAHWEPALAETEPALEEALAAVLGLME